MMQAIEKKMEEKIHEEVVNQAEAEKKQRKEAEVKRLLAEEEKAARKANESVHYTFNLMLSPNFFFYRIGRFVK